MPHVIYKYVIRSEPGAYILLLPKGAQIVGPPQLQRSIPHIWVRFDPAEQDTVCRRFAVVATGHPFPAHWAYIGMWQELPLVWHLLEIPE